MALLEFLAGAARARLVAADLAAVPDEGLDGGGALGALPGQTLARSLALLCPGLAACTCPDRPKPGARCPHCQIREAEDALAKIN